MWQLVQDGFDFTEPVIRSHLRIGALLIDWVTSYLEMICTGLVVIINIT